MPLRNIREITDYYFDLQFSFVYWVIMLELMGFSAIYHTCFKCDTVLCNGLTVVKMWALIVFPLIPLLFTITLILEIIKLIISPIVVPILYFCVRIFNIDLEKIRDTYFQSREEFT